MNWESLGRETIDLLRPDAAMLRTTFAVTMLMLLEMTAA